MAICDNDEGATFQIEEFIESTYEKHGVEMEIDVYYSGEKLAEAISQGKMYDIIYLDIQMGGLDGLAVGKYIRKMELDSIIVYISEYIEYIESVFEVEAFEFIRKPISNEKFMLTLKRALNRLDRKQYFFDCKYKNYWIRIPIKDIVYFESSGRKINIHLKDNKMEIFNGKLDNVEIKLSNSPSLFLRIHKSYLVNLSYIRAISGKKARLINELVLPISDDRKDNVRKQYVKCLGEDISERDNSISNLLMPLCSVWIVNKFVNNSFEKKESKKIFTRIIWGLFILIQIVMETEKGNVSIQKGIISFFVILGIIIIG